MRIKFGGLFGPSEYESTFTPTPAPTWPWPAESRWQKCPVCAGCGTVPHDFYNKFGASTSTTREQCRSCAGRGIVK